VFVDPQLHLFVTIGTVLAFYLIPRDCPQQRLTLLIGASALLIFYAAPYALIACAVLASATLILGKALASGERSSVFYAGALSLPILTIALFEYAEAETSVLARLGVSYFALKAMTVLVDCRRGHASPAFGEILLLLMFYPIYSAGPIERARALRRTALQSPFSIDNIGQGLLRIAMGIFLSIYVAKHILETLIEVSFPAIAEAPGQFSALAVYGYLLLNFLALYVAFTGYTDIAIGTARLLGIPVQENFRFPLLATSIQNFWQRWHLSLSAIISAYLFKPMVRATGRPMLAIFSAFTVIGLWHDVTWQYLLWGAGHGGALALNYRYGRYCATRPGLQAFHQHALVRNASRVLTLSYIALVSGFANAPDLGAALRMVGALFGFGEA